MNNFAIIWAEVTFVITFISFFLQTNRSANLTRVAVHSLFLKISILNSARHWHVLADSWGILIMIVHIHKTRLHFVTVFEGFIYIFVFHFVLFSSFNMYRQKNTILIDFGHPKDANPFEFKRNLHLYIAILWNRHSEQSTRERCSMYMWLLNVIRVSFCFFLSPKLFE